MEHYLKFEYSGSIVAFVDLEACLFHILILPPFVF